MSKKIIDLVMEQALKNGQLEIYNMELDRWNLGSMVDGAWVDSQDPKPDGTYDKMGLDSSDVMARYKFYWWKPSNWSSFARSFADYLKNIKEFVLEGFFTKLVRRPKDLIQDIKKWVFKYSPFEVSVSSWVWVVDAKSSVIKSHAHDMAEKTVAIEKGYGDQLDYFEKTGKTMYENKADVARIEKIAEKLVRMNPDIVFEDFLETNEYRPVAPYMWVSKSDITCFIIDEYVAPFDMRDGWSSEALCRPIAAWVRVAYGVDLQVVYRPEKNDE